MVRVLLIRDIMKGVRKLPVVEDDRLVGIVTSIDLMRTGPKLVDLLES
jgi:CBS domain-containing protein